MSENRKGDFLTHTELRMSEVTLIGFNVKDNELYVVGDSIQVLAVERRSFRHAFSCRHQTEKMYRCFRCVSYLQPSGFTYFQYSCMPTSGRTSCCRLLISVYVRYTGLQVEQAGRRRSSLAAMTSSKAQINYPRGS